MIELVTTSGVFALDGGQWDVTNNIWLVGGDREVIVIDAAHDARPIVAAVAGSWNPKTPGAEGAPSAADPFTGPQRW